MSAFAGMEDILKEFLVESYENLDRLDQEFVVLEEDPGNRDVLAGIFRTIHTIKGTSGFFGLCKLEKLTHAGESLLSLLRDGKKALNPEITTALLTLVDAVRVMLHSIESSQSEGERDYADLIAILASHLEPGPASTAPAALPVAPASPVSSAAPAVQSAPEEPAPEPAPEPEPVPSLGQILVQSGAAKE
jgi:two-component system, chemotaxis family, sensor kinase CheA